MTWVEHDEPSWLDHIPPGIRAASRLALRLLLIILFLLALLALFYWQQASRFDLNDVTRMPERTLILDSEGRELAAVHGTRRRLIEKHEIPAHLVKALLAREDRHFFQHSGVHLRGILRAALRNLSDRELSQGASTLTMQLARNTFELRSHSLHRKLLETALAFRLEANFSKDEILTAYLNRIYFGSGTFGIEQAAKSYFGKTTKNLTLAETALLVGIIRAPHDFSPRNNPDLALRERNHVLNQLLETNNITSEQAEDARKAPLHLLPPRNSQTDAIRCIRRHLNELLDSGDFKRGGLTATSTINRDRQKQVRNSLDTLLAPFPNLQTALVAIHPATGKIQAIITARDPNSSQFNRAFDTKRQLGPVFQPFIYAFATERGRLAITNQPIQTARLLPETELARLAKRLGLHPPFPNREEFARGNFTATPLQAATALTALANDGTWVATHLISRLTDPKDQILFQQKTLSRPVLSPEATQAAFQSSGSSTWTSLNAPKTDFWALHASPELVLALWFGYDNPKIIPDSQALEKGSKRLIQQLLTPGPAF
ncbi:MAG: transglycosylase domain-containing protein [Verrucomicrobiota bacterium]